MYSYLGEGGTTWPGAQLTNVKGSNRLSGWSLDPSPAT